MINVMIIADSLAPSGVRLTTFVLEYPRFIHAEFMTHRMFSRNASSSRAIPFKKQVQMIKENMAAPIEFRTNKKGMQAGGAMTDQEKLFAIWREASEDAIRHAHRLSDFNCHKQYVNRLIEPFTHIKVICTSSDYTNFFGLRVHSMAQPEICALATLMYEEYKKSSPKKLTMGEWHLPFVTEDEYTEGLLDEEAMEYNIKKSIACCARVSYQNHDSTNSTPEQNEALCDRLLSEQPIHASPAEHQAMAIGDPNVISGNFKGWIQYRKTLNGEKIESFEPGMYEKN